MSVERFEALDDADMVAVKNGAWVRAEDFDAAAEEAERSRDRLRAAIEHAEKMLPDGAAEAKAHLFGALCWEDRSEVEPWENEVAEELAADRSERNVSSESGASGSENSQGERSDQNQAATFIEESQGGEERLEEALRAIHFYLRLKDGESHKDYGGLCGEDSCILCLAEETARAALSHDPDPSGGLVLGEEEREAAVEAVKHEIRERDLRQGFEDEDVEARVLARAVLSALPQPAPVLSGEGAVHELKCWPPYFWQVATGRKNFELRRDDGRGFEEGDTLWLREWDPEIGNYAEDAGRYTGRECRRRVGVVLRGAVAVHFGLVNSGWVAMSLDPPDLSQPVLSEREARLEAALRQIPHDEYCLASGMKEGERNEHGVPETDLCDCAVKSIRSALSEQPEDCERFVIEFSREEAQAMREWVGGFDSEQYRALTATDAAADAKLASALHPALYPKPEDYAGHPANKKPDQPEQPEGERCGGSGLIHHENDLYTADPCPGCPDCTEGSCNCDVRGERVSPQHDQHCPRYADQPVQGEGEAG